MAGVVSSLAHGMAGAAAAAAAASITGLAAFSALSIALSSPPPACLPLPLPQNTALFNPTHLRGPLPLSPARV